MTLSLIYKDEDAAIIIMDETHKISSWNKQAEKLFGWTESEAIGGNVVTLLIPPELHAEHLKSVNKAVFHGLSDARKATAPTDPALEAPALKKGGGTIQVRIRLSEWRVPGTKERWFGARIWEALPPDELAAKIKEIEDAKKPVSDVAPAKITAVVKEAAQDAQRAEKIIQKAAAIIEGSAVGVVTPADPETKT